MNEIVERKTNLPDTIEDLTQFVLVGKAKLRAYMLKLQTVNKLSVAQEIRDQTLKEAQEVSTALIAAEQRIGELLLAIPKQSGASNFSRDVEKLKTKTETVKEMGYSKDEASDYQQMAKNPEIVQKVLDDAIEKGEIATKTQVMKEIKAAKDESKAEIQKLVNANAALQQENLRLRNQKPIVKEVVTKEAQREIEDLKRKLDDANDTANRRLQEKKDAERELLQIRTELKQQEGKTPEETHRHEIEKGIRRFIAATYTYVRDYAEIISDETDLLGIEQSEIKKFKTALYSIDRMARQLIERTG